MLALLLALVLKVLLTTIMSQPSFSETLSQISGSISTGVTNAIQYAKCSRDYNSTSGNSNESDLRWFVAWGVPGLKCLRADDISHADFKLAIFLTVYLIRDHNTRMLLILGRRPLPAKRKKTC